MASNLKYRMRVLVQVSKVDLSQQVATQQGPRDKEVEGENYEAVAERHSRGACLDEIMEDTALGEFLQRVREEQGKARGLEIAKN